MIQATLSNKYQISRSGSPNGCYIEIDLAVGDKIPGPGDFLGEKVEITPPGLVPTFRARLTLYRKFEVHAVGGMVRLTLRLHYDYERLSE